MDIVGIGDRYKGIIGVRGIRKKRLNYLGSNQLNVLVRAFRSCVLKMAQSFLPLDYKKIVEESLKELVYGKH